MEAVLSSLYDKPSAENGVPVVKQLTEDVVFVLGKGGTGRTTVAAALAKSFADKGELTLLVQWALVDAVSPLFGLSQTQHEVRKIGPHFHVMNYSFEQALEEYFVSHLGARKLFDVVLKNAYFQKLVNAAPGLQELFFLGRIFWLAELCEKERGWRYDRIVVDAPASGHGISLFDIPQAVARLGIPGPLTAESQRVARFLDNRNRVGVVLVSTPEELPVEEMLELVPKVQSALQRFPLFAVLNRCLPHRLFVGGKRGMEQSTHWTQSLSRTLEHRSNEGHLLSVIDAMVQRREFEMQLAERLALYPLPLCCLSDVYFQNTDAKPVDVIEAVSKEFNAWVGKGPS
jgi:hypothetical protein